MPPKGCQCSRHKEIALPRQGKCAHPSLTLRTIQFSYRGNTKAHFQIGSLIDIKNIYIFISTIYYTVLTKNGF